MDVLAAFADILAETGENEPWFIEAKDSNPASELQRQMTFLSMLGQLGPSCDVLAIPNAGKASDWERIQRWKEGARAGALDLLITWSVDLPGHGVFLAEMKNGKSMPTPAQVDRLNRYYRQGHGCGVYRTAECLLEHLRRAGAPIMKARSI